MRDSDKPFVLYRRGPMNFSIVPRGVKGWTQSAVWMLMLAPLTIAFAVYAEAHEGTPRVYIALGLYLVATAIWSVAMIRWMKARAEVVDVKAMLAIKQQAERDGRRR